MRRVARRDESVRIEHQRFVGAGGDRLDARGDAIELAVRVELGILHIGIAATHVDCEQRQSRRECFGLRRLVFGNDDDRRGADRRARVLVGRALDAARDHQPDVHAVLHPVGGQGVVDRFRQLPADRGRCRARSPSPLRTAGRDARRERPDDRRARASLPTPRRPGRTRCRTPRQPRRHVASTCRSRRSLCRRCADRRGNRGCFAPWTAFAGRTPGFNRTRLAPEPQLALAVRVGVDRRHPLP